ncbi:prepilin-type N-terminal cleavage/methylation domain-containing protein [Paraglaciecola aquimarina]|uniref:Prepilin-type N-terminal cleavage/methylation domain-containing protein n=1 Tax=Paraglaciecola aquimarina TaxID=1235557 RepID=A0ABU3SSX8_9ALTE|nr:prepilin-type N-terminal cleavage/methylation domain-containing protein [Paraglaciecola aquimarina]MDU0353120.1 prepilin-type N-terminal cleavage/methylation domain-containing protein [Paraglaciecola aquimarina]
MRHQQSGFTLIELIIVIVILGILAVTAAPKFIDIQSDATASTLQGVKASLQGGAQLVFAKSAIAGEQGNAYTSTGTSSQITAGGQNINTDYGYPDAETAAGTLSGWVDISSAEFTVVAGPTTGTAGATTTSPAAGAFAIIPATGSPTIDYTKTGVTEASCHVLYTEATGKNVPPVVTVVSGGC